MERELGEHQFGSAAAIAIDLLDSVWNSGDLEAAARYIADGYTIHHDPGDPWEGQRLSLEEYRNRVRLYREQVPDLRFTVQEILADDTKVMVAWLFNGTTAGKSLAASGATVYYLENGRISGHWQVTHRP